jgi:hypothetical protein
MPRYQQQNYRNFSRSRSQKSLKKRLIFTGILILFFVYALLAWILPALIGGLSFLNHSSTPKSNKSSTDNVTIAPPILNIPYEATNTATISINGYAQAGSKVEIYVDDDLKTAAQTTTDGSFQASGIELALGTNNIWGKTVDDKGTKSLSSKPIRIQYSNQKPKLEVDSPSDNQVVKGGDKKVTVSGVTDPGNDLRANDFKLIVNSEGKFSQTISINDGDNQITITSTDDAGNTNSVSRKVTYQAS